MITINKPFTRNTLNEIMQQKQTRYAHAVVEEDGSITQVHQECLCRDFLGDVVVSNVQNQKYEIYGMSYDPKKDVRINLERTQLLIYFPKVEDEKCFEENFKFLQMLEDSYGIKKSSFIDVEPKVKLVTGNKWWMEELYRFSFYTFVLRCLTYKVKAETPEEMFSYIADNYPTNEKKYISDYRVQFDKFVKTLPLIKRYNYKLYTNPTKELDLSSNDWNFGIEGMHNYTGFYTYLSFATKGLLK
jgi:hypothetical protein